MSERNIAQALNDALDVALTEPHVVLLGEDVGRTGGGSGRELRGQTFTLSNIGAVGGRYGTPIVPLGTTAILSVGRAEPRPVVRDDALAIATEMPLSLSYDHRATDGGTGRAFLGAVVAAFEAPAE